MLEIMYQASKVEAMKDYRKKYKDYKQKTGRYKSYFINNQIKKKQKNSDLKAESLRLSYLTI